MYHPRHLVNFRKGILCWRFLQTQVFYIEIQTKKGKNKIIPNPNFTWKNFRFFAASPSLGPGIDFSPNKPHFEQIFGYLINGSASHRYMMQVHGRNRTTSMSTTTHLYFTRLSKTNMCEMEEIEKHMKTQEKQLLNQMIVKLDISTCETISSSSSLDDDDDDDDVIRKAYKIDPKIEQVVRSYISEKIMSQENIRRGVVEHIFKSDPMAVYLFDPNIHGKSDTRLNGTLSDESRHLKKMRDRGINV